MAEDIEIVNALKKLAKKQGKTLTEIYSEAVREFLARRKKPEKQK